MLCYRKKTWVDGQTYRRMDEWTNEWWRMTCCRTVSSCHVALRYVWMASLRTWCSGFGRRHASLNENAWICRSYVRTFAFLHGTSKGRMKIWRRRDEKPKEKLNTFTDRGGTFHRWPNTMSEPDHRRLPWAYPDGADPDAIVLVDNQHDISWYCQSSWLQCVAKWLSLKLLPRITWL